MFSKAKKRKAKFRGFWSLALRRLYLDYLALSLSPVQEWRRPALRMLQAVLLVPEH
jgi:hypothetical protein